MVWYVLRVGFLLLWHHLVGRPAPSNEAFRVRMRAWPWLCDAYRHLNNAAYLRLAEDARWVWTARTPLLKRALSDRWLFLVGGADVLYRREIRLMSPFEIVSRVIGADERWLYFSQEFVLPDGRVACRVLVRAMVRSPAGAVTPAEVAAVAGATIPQANPEVEHMRNLADLQLAAIRDEGRG